jgi:3-hydroxybutyryl-CoA dehydrogenase
MKRGTNVPMGPLTLADLYVASSFFCGFLFIFSLHTPTFGVFLFVYCLVYSIGLDTCLSIMQVLYNQTSDSKYRPSVLLSRMVDAGWLGKSFSPRYKTCCHPCDSLSSFVSHSTGKKVGKGFYEYDS